MKFHTTEQTPLQIAMVPNKEKYESKFNISFYIHKGHVPPEKQDILYRA